MKTKLVAILMILLFSGIFTACSEEEIAPQDAANEVSTRGLGTDLKDAENF